MFRARQLRVYPTADQHATLQKMMYWYQWTYNQCVKHHATTHGADGPKTKWLGKTELCNLFVTKEAVLKLNTLNDVQKQELLSVHNQERQEAVREFITARTTASDTFKRTGKQWNFKTRSSRHGMCVTVQARDYGRTSGDYFKLFHPSQLRSTQSGKHNRLPTTMYAAFKVVYRRGRYYLNYVIPIDKPSENLPAATDRVIVIDPGVRTFATAFDPGGGVTYEWGTDHDHDRLLRELQRADTIQAKIDGVHYEKRSVADFSSREDKCLYTKQARNRAKCTRRRLRRAFMAARENVRNRVRDIHYKMAAWLTDNFDAILIPTFNVSQMVVRDNRKIRKKTVREMVAWSHYNFRQILKQRAERIGRPHIVVECDEAYTSKTCGVCGWIHDKLGGNKTFKCDSCGYAADRDFNGARNILLRYISLNLLA